MAGTGGPTWKASMALRAQNTMSEGLSAMLQDIGGMKALPDADLNFLTEMETMILGKLRAPVDAMAGNSGPGSPGPAGIDMSAGPVPGMGPGSTPPMPPMPPMGPMGGPPMGSPGGPPRGLPPSPQMPSPDELRRVLGNPGAGG